MKVNVGFFEAFGSAGWAALERLRAEVPPELVLIADAKRGDIGTSAERYAAAILGHLGADGITVSPYLGEDGVAPFVEHGAAIVYVLARTSNPSAGTLQDLAVDGAPAPRARRALGGPDLARPTHWPRRRRDRSGGARPPPRPRAADAVPRPGRGGTGRRPGGRGAELRGRRRARPREHVTSDRRRLARRGLAACRAAGRGPDGRTDAGGGRCYTRRTASGSRRRGTASVTENRHATWDPSDGLSS